MSMQMPPAEIIQHYLPSAGEVQVAHLGHGNINDTFLLHQADKKIVLQRINHQVFPEPQLLIDNLQLLSSHLRARPENVDQRWEEVLLLPTRNGKLSVRDGAENLWRALSYVPRSVSVTRVTSSFQAEQTGWALGHFHRRLEGISAHRMRRVLPGFHHTSSYLREYDRLAVHGEERNIEECRFCREIIRRERDDALALERGLREGKLKERVVHGDPKVANILFDRESGRALSIIDLDTVGPGLIQHDIGDCLRSVCNRAGEDGEAADSDFDLDLCQAALQGYLGEAGPLLSPMDPEYIYEGLKCITFELGLRFFTDYLQGNIYFKGKSPEETLRKALVQFTLLEDIINKEQAIRRLSLVL